MDQKTALAQNLTFVTDNTVIMRADSQTVLKPEDPGRNTVRIVSKKTYTTHTVVYVYLQPFPRSHVFVD